MGKSKSKKSGSSAEHCCGTTMKLDTGVWYCPSCDVDGIRQLIVDAVGSSDPEEAAADFAFWMAEKDNIISGVARTKEALDQFQDHLLDTYGNEDEDFVTELENEFGEDFCTSFGELGEAIADLHKVVNLSESHESDRKDLDNIAHSWLYNPGFKGPKELPLIKPKAKIYNRIFFTEVDSWEEDFSLGSYIISCDILMIMDAKDLQSLNTDITKT